MPPDPPSLVCLRKLDIHVTPLLKILATAWSGYEAEGQAMSVCVRWEGGE